MALVSKYIVNYDTFLGHFAYGVHGDAPLGLQLGSRDLVALIDQTECDRSYGTWVLDPLPRNEWRGTLLPLLQWGYALAALGARFHNWVLGGHGEGVREREKAQGMSSSLRTSRQPRLALLYCNSLQGRAREEHKHSTMLASSRASFPTPFPSNFPVSGHFCADDWAFCENGQAQVCVYHSKKQEVWDIYAIVSTLQSRRE